MTDNEKTTDASDDARPTRRVGRGILIGAIAASLVGGIALGGAGGFVLASSAIPSAPSFAEQGGMPGQPPASTVPDDSSTDTDSDTQQN